MINRVVLVGRMTKDPVLSRTHDGQAVTRFTLALNRSYNDQEADFINVVCWRNTAESVDKYCTKGSLVGVEGRLRSGTYQNNQGQKVFTVDVQADRVQFIETRRQEQSAQPNNYQQPQFNNYQQPVQQAQPNNFYSQRMPVQNETQNGFYDTKTVDGFYDKVSIDPTGGSYNIMDDDIGF